MQRGRYRNNRGAYRGRGGGRGGPSTRAPRGLFEGGVWKCDCDPPQIAEHFKVKKEGKNQGRWFYTCQKDQNSRCGFFLWDEDANLRMKATVIGNSRTEPGQDKDVQEGWNAGRSTTVMPPGRGMFAGVEMKREESPTPTPSSSLCSNRTTTSSRKRNAHEALLDADDEGQPWELTGEEEEALAMVAATPMETPQKAPKTGVYATPATTTRKAPRTLPWLQQEPITPITNKKKSVADYFAMSSKQAAPATKAAFASTDDSTQSEDNGEEEDETPATPKPPPTLTVPASPSPARYKDALLNPADSASSLTNEVLTELSSIKLPPEKLSSLRTILSRHDLRTQGVTKGRDISRLALKAKEAKIVELEATVASLEAERAVDRGVIQQLKWKQENGQEDDEEETQL